MGSTSADGRADNLISILVESRGNLLLKLLARSQRDHIAAPAASGDLRSQGAIFKSRLAHLVQDLVRELHLAKELVILRHDLSNGLQIAGFQGLFHLLAL